MTGRFLGTHCRDCGADALDGACSACGGLLDPQYEQLVWDRGPVRAMWDLESVLPMDADDAITLGEGGTPLVDCPALAADLAVDTVLVKDEGTNPTESVAARGASLAISMVTRADATDVVLASAGADAQAVAAYAGRAGIECHAYLPTRAPFVAKAMVNVHGADMTVVGGRLSAAETAARDVPDDWHRLEPFASPYRHEALKTIAYELVADLGAAPDAVVYPTGSGAGLVGLAKGFRELQSIGAIEGQPALFAAQAAGCAPIAAAMTAGALTTEPVEHPDTICGELEVPDPAGGAWALEALRETGGGAVTVTDPAALEAAVTIAAHEGVSMAPSAAVAAAGLGTLVDEGAIGADDTAVVVNTVGGTGAADVLRSHLMGQGI